MGVDTDREEVKAVLRSIYEGVRRYSLEAERMYEQGIEGIERRVRNPDLETGQNRNGEEYLYDFPSFYQTDGVEFILENKRALISDEMGVGKTAQAVAAKLEMENRYGGRVKTLVVTPNQVKELWEEKIGEYTSREQEVARLDSYDEASLARMKDADFTIVNFEAFGCRGLRDSLTDRLLREGFNYVILDEVHNTKNPSARRSGQIRWIADRADYLCLLSGTPVPDNLGDTYMLIALLESDVYKDMVFPHGDELPRDRVEGLIPRGALLVDEDNNVIGEGQYYATPEGLVVSDSEDRVRWADLVRTAPHVVRDTYFMQPTLIRAILGRRKLRRDMEDVVTLPEIHRCPEGLSGILELTPEQKEFYDAIYENDELEGPYKLLQLRKALTNPALINPKLLPEHLRARAVEVESVKYTALDSIVSERAGRGKLVVFSPIFKRGVVKNLQNRYRGYGALRIDGDIKKSSRREEIRRAFQRDPDKRILIATNVAGEGIALTAASTVVFLDEPYSPGARSQMVKRVHRRGQRNPVDIISLAVRDTVDDGMLELLHLKQEAINFIERGMRLRPEHIEAIGSRPSTARPLRDKQYTAQQKVGRYSSRMAGMGSKIISRALARHEDAMARKYAEWYIIDWEQSYSANVMRGVKSVIDALSPRVEMREKLDIASAFGVLSEVLGEETTNVELNKYHFQEESDRNIVASMHDIPLPDGRFDLAVCSLALYDTTIDKEWEKGRKKKASKAKPGPKITEREKAIREANRVLKTGGHYIVTMPRTVITPGQDRAFRGSLERLGFEVVPELTGYVKIGSQQRLQTYFAVARKIGPPRKRSLGTKMLSLEVDDRTAGKRRRSYSGVKGVFQDFTFLTPEGDEAIEDRASAYLRRLFGGVMYEK